MRTVCRLCPHHCVLEEGQTGRCRGRENRGGSVVCANYGRLTSVAVDPIEKKPFRRFHPGRYILSVGSYGCNLRCPFCQNHEISMAGAEIPAEQVSPERLVELAMRLTHTAAGNIGVAFSLILGTTLGAFLGPVVLQHLSRERLEKILPPLLIVLVLGMGGIVFFKM